MAEQEDEEQEEREYGLQEAAALLNKSEAALRMQIRRDSIRAVKRPLDDTGRYKYYIQESEIDKERRRIQASTRRTDDAAPSPSTAGLEWRNANASTIRGEGDLGSAVAALRERQEQIARELQEEREDTRALIRALEKQVDLLKMMLTTVMEK